MKKLTSFLIATVILVGSGALAYYLVSTAPEPERREPPPQIPFARTARVVAGSGAIPVYGAGTVRPSAEIDIAPLVSGNVVWMNPAFQSGGRIRAGQAIFRIEKEDYLHRLRQVEAELEARRVALFVAKEEAAFARTEFEQYSRQQIEAGASAGEPGPLALKEPQIKAAQAAIDRVESQLADARLALSRTEVRAPFGGYVRHESLDVGQFVTAGQAVGRLFAAEAVEVVVPLSDANAALIPGLWKLRAGDARRRVSARVIAEYGAGSYAWRGYVDRAEVSIDEQSRTIDAVVRVPNPFSSGKPTRGAGQPGSTPPLLVGKFVEVEIQGLVPESYFRVPRPALHPGNEVWTVGEDRKVGIVPVRVLQRVNDEAFVIGALQDGQPVIIGGVQLVTEGMTVRTEEGSAR
ncbi:MAG: efflux RND transporter periplasmic adaptor subunit [Acidobacteria bacterium]|nr:efflux RND transporter periplasmic adaptor subunit [Acidobacteriota bacterium]